MGSWHCVQRAFAVLAALPMGADNAAAICCSTRRCISRSPNAPADCEGDDCNVYVEE